LGVNAIADDYLFEAKLVDQSGTVPARRERSHEDKIAVAGLATRGAESIGFTVHRGIAILDQAVAAHAHDSTIGTEDCSANRDTSLGESNAGLFERDCQHAVRVQSRFHPEECNTAKLLDSMERPKQTQRSTRKSKSDLREDRTLLQDPAGQLQTLEAETKAEASQPTYGLRRHVLGPLESLAQSISTMAPTCSPALTVPLVFATAGNGTWLAYLLAAICTLLVALCIARFARESASPGSLYTYATSSLPPVLGSVAAWALLLAYVATGASVTGGFIHYANVVLGEFFGVSAPAIPLAILAVLISIWIAYRDIKVSARLMVYVELVSVLLISGVFALLLWQRGLHFDPQQFTLRGVRWSGIRLGLVLAMFSFVGFESATTLGEEARHPLRTIPRAVIQSAILSGLFFIAASYTEVLSFPPAAGSLDQNAAPMSVLSTVAGVRRLGPVIDICAMVSMFSCALACVTAAARVLLLMAHNGLAHHGLARTHRRNATPHVAVLATGAATMMLPVALAAAKVGGETIYDWMGSLATYGFITVYALVGIALPWYLWRLQRLTFGIVALAVLVVASMAMVLAGTLYPVPEPPKNWLPYIFLIYLAAAIGWHHWRTWRRVDLSAKVS
jgi:amino acid transporter